LGRVRGALHLLSTPESLPIFVGILNFRGTHATSATGILAAGGVMALLPAIVVFLLPQRFIVGRLISGALKGWPPRRVRPAGPGVRSHA
jgi:multiple sugar transport system permease protein